MASPCPRPEAESARRQRRLVAVLLLSVGLSACGESEGTAERSLRNEADRSLDLSGTDEVAELTTTDDAAQATIALVGLVGATAAVFGELGDAVGEVIEDEDSACPGGGSASGDLSGSLNHPRLRMEFRQCVRGAVMLDGVATIRCEDFNGTDCHSGQALLGEGDSALLFRGPLSGGERLVLMLGEAEITNDESAQRLHVNATLRGEMRAVAGDARYSFVTEALAVEIQEVDEDRRQVRIEGVTGFGGGAEAAACIRGRYDSESPQPLVVSDSSILGGELRHHSPPPRPGSAVAETRYVESALEVQAPDGTRRNYQPAELAEFCSLDS